MITVSIVSHRTGNVLRPLLADLAECEEVARVVLTLNLPEPEPAIPKALIGRVTVLRNAKPRGFGANHNAAFRYCDTPYFCVLNPDVRLNSNPFPTLLGSLKGDTGVCAPAVINPLGEIEDNARCFPTPVKLLLKLLNIADGRYEYARGELPFEADWVAGMFMLFVSTDFAAVHGFDEEYYLYYEDVDICVRLWNAGRKVVLCPQAVVVHAAQRASHRNMRHLGWHLASLTRYLMRHWGRLPAAGVR